MTDTSTAPAAAAAPPADQAPPEYTPPATQADLDRIIGERVARERGKYGDYADLKAKAAKYDELEAASASDLEKAVKAARQEGRAEAQTATNAVLVKAEARAQAASAKFRDPADALGFLDLSSVKVAEDGTVDAPAVKALLDDLAKSKPYLLADDSTPPPNFDGGSRTPNGKPASMNEFIRGRLRG